MIPHRLNLLRKKLSQDGEPVSCRQLAAACGVNIRYMADLFERGIEPKNKELRRKMLFPKRMRRSANYASRITKAMLEQPPHRTWWRRLSVNARDACIWNEHKIYMEYEKEKCNERK